LEESLKVRESKLIEFEVESVTVFCSDIVGYTAKKLRGLGARVTVLARRREVRKQAKEDGFYAVDFAFGPEEAMGAAMLVNTVPAPVVTRVIIKELPRDAYILDIASKPGGTDFACAKEFGIRADLVLGIPGKYAPKESAYILERSMERFAAK
jgi:dipicolinate synthase subunit A